MISIIIPYFNSQSTINKVLGRLKEISKGISLEVIVVDDHSSELPELINWDCVKVIRHDCQKGPGAARNTGLKAAVGEVFVYLDSDVIIEKKQLEFIHDYFFKETSKVYLTSTLKAEVGNNLATLYKNLYINYQFSLHSGEVDFVYGSLGATNSRVLWPETIQRTEDNLFGLKLIKNDVRVILESSLEVIHLKKYTIGSLLIYDFKTAFSMAYSILVKRKMSGAINSSIGNTNSLQLLGIIFIFFNLLSLVISLKFSLAFFILWNICFMKFYSYCYKKIGRSSIFIPFFCVFSEFCHGIGAILGLCFYKIKLFFDSREVDELFK